MYDVCDDDRMDGGPRGDLIRGRDATHGCFANDTEGDGSTAKCFN